MKAVVLLGLATALATAHAFWLWDQLPPRVIVHLNLWGEPDGWGSRNVWLGTYLGAVFVIAATFGAADVASARGHIEINVPHPEHWMAPERQHRSVRFVRRSLFWLGLATLVLVGTTMHVVGRASLAAETPDSVMFWPLFVAYLVVVFAIGAAQLSRFRAPRNPSIDEG